MDGNKSKKVEALFLSQYFHSHILETLGRPTHRLTVVRSIADFFRGCKKTGNSIYSGLASERNVSFLSRLKNGKLYGKSGCWRNHFYCGSVLAFALASIHQYTVDGSDKMHERKRKRRWLRVRCYTLGQPFRSLLRLGSVSAN